MTDEEACDVAELRRIAAAIGPDDRSRVPPPAQVWTNISAAVGSDVRRTAPELVARESLSTDLERVDADAEVVVAYAPTSDVDIERLRKAPNVRRRQRRNVAVAAIAASVVFVIGFSLWRGAEPERLAVSTQTNDGLSEPYDGTAMSVVELAGNERRIVIDFDDPLPSDEPLELWLITPDMSEMTSLGPIDDVAFYPIPPEIDINEFSIIDISVEPNDGDPAHSGRSILRGELVPT